MGAGEAAGEPAEHPGPARRRGPGSDSSAVKPRWSTLTRVPPGTGSSVQRMMVCRYCSQLGSQVYSSSRGGSTARYSPRTSELPCALRGLAAPLAARAEVHLPVVGLVQVGASPPAGQLARVGERPEHRLGRGGDLHRRPDRSLPARRPPRSSLSSLEVSLQALEIERPEGAVALDPPVGLGERRRGELVAAQPSLAALADQARLAKDAEVLGDGGTAGAEVRGELADRAAPGAEAIQERAPGRVGDGAEDVGVCPGPVHR